MNKTLKFPYLEELHGYLKCGNEKRNLLVRHKKFGLGKIKELRKNAVNENVVVRFYNDGNAERIFTFPLCFLQGYLELEEGWEEIVKNTITITPTPVNMPIQEKGEEVTNEDISILRAYFGVQTEKPLLRVYDKWKGEGMVVEYFGESIKVSFFFDFDMFRFPEDFINGRLRLQKGDKELIRQFLKKPNPPKPPISEELELAVERLTTQRPIVPHEENEEKPMKKVIGAKTNAEFLNKIFGTNYKQWYKSVWRYSHDCLVWMVPFDEKTPAGIELDGLWENVWTNEPKEVLEMYKGKGIPAPPKTKYRIVVEKTKNDNGKRVYVIHGKYEWDRTKGDSRNRYYKRIADVSLNK